MGVFYLAWRHMRCFGEPAPARRRKRGPRSTGVAYRTAFVEHLEDRRMLSLGDLLDIFPDASLPAGSSFGHAVAASERWAVIGAPYDDTTDAGSGHVWVYDLENPETAPHIISKPGPYNPGQFGYSVAVAGDTVAVATRNDAQWRLATVDLFDAATGDHLRTIADPVWLEGTGSIDCAVALVGNQVIVGVPDTDHGGMTCAGAVYLYDATTGAQTQMLVHPAPANDDWFGFSVAGFSSTSNGDLVAVGAPSDNEGGGSVHLFDADTGAHVRVLENPAPAGFDFFGDSVAASGDQVVVGAPYEEVGSYYGAGAAYVFNLESGGFKKLVSPTPETSYRLGSSVAALGRMVVAGAPDSDQGAVHTGAVYVFDAETGYCLFMPTQPGLPDEGAYFGLAVAAGGSADAPRVLVGAPYSEYWGEAGGAAFLYDLGDDTVAPTADIIDVSPDPRTTAVDTIAIRFSEAVTGLDLADLSLTRDGSANLLTAAQALTTTDHITWWLGNLAGLTGVPLRPGSYLLKLTAAGSGIIDWAGNPLAADATDAWQTDPPLLAVFPDGSLPAGSKFGHAVAASERWAVVGTPYYDFTTYADSGYVWVYDLENPGSLIGINNPTPYASDLFGWSVAVSGDMVAVGTPFCNYSGYTDPGAVYLFSATTGTLLRTILNPTLADHDRFGWSVGFVGTQLIVGAPYADHNSKTNPGAVYLFNKDTGTRGATLVHTSPANYDYFGWSVAGFSAHPYYGDLVAVGAPYDDVSTTDDGSLHVFYAETGAYSWGLRQSLTPAAYDYFGYSVAASGYTIVAGAPGDDEGGADAGAAYTWNQQGPVGVMETLPNPAPQAGAQFGYSVAMLGRMVAVGAPYDDQGAADTGAVYVFDSETGYSLTTLTQPGAVDGEAHFGFVVAAGGTVDAPRLLVGAPDSQYYGAAGGAAFLYDFDDTVAPTADIIDVTPDPRTTAVDTITIRFSEPVTGFDLTDLSLTRNGGANPLTEAQSLTTTDGLTWQLETLSGLTGASGSYVLELTAAGSGIIDWAGNPLAVDAIEAWENSTLRVVRIGLAPSSLPENWYPVPMGSVNQLKAFPMATVDIIEIEFSEPVVLDKGDLALVGVNTAGFNIAESTFSCYSRYAWWTLPHAIGADKLLLCLDADSICDEAGNLLDGEWTDCVSCISGDGSPGGDFHFRFNVLPGDLNGDGLVGQSDFGIFAYNYGAGPFATPFMGDLNGDGSVSNSDFGIFAFRYGSSLPAGEPVAPMSATALGLDFAAPLETTNSGDEDLWLADADALLFTERQAKPSLPAAGIAASKKPALAPVDNALVEQQVRRWHEPTQAQLRAVALRSICDELSASWCEQSAANDEDRSQEDGDLLQLCGSQWSRGNK